MEEVGGDREVKRAFVDQVCNDKRAFKDGGGGEDERHFKDSDVVIDETPHQRWKMWGRKSVDDEGVNWDERPIGDGGVTMTATAMTVIRQRSSLDFETRVNDW